MNTGIALEASIQRLSVTGLACGSVMLAGLATGCSAVPDKGVVSAKAQVSTSSLVAAGLSSANRSAKAFEGHGSQIQDTADGASSAVYQSDERHFRLQQQLPPRLSNINIYIDFTTTKNALSDYTVSAGELRVVRCSVLRSHYSLKQGIDQRETAEAVLDKDATGEWRYKLVQDQLPGSPGACEAALGITKLVY